LGRLRSERRLAINADQQVGRLPLAVTESVRLSGTDKAQPRLLPRLRRRGLRRDGPGELCPRLTRSRQRRVWGPD